MNINDIVAVFNEVCFVVGFFSGLACSLLFALYLRS